MVLLDVIEVVEIIHHQAIRLRDGTIGRVGKPVDAFKPRTIAEMETRHRIHRGAALVARSQEVPRGGPHQRFLKLAEDFRIGPPMRPLKQLKGYAIAGVDGRRVFVLDLAGKPVGETRHRR